MAPDYKSILVLMNLILAACAGIASVGFYRILKTFGLIPWKPSNSGKKTYPGEKKELDMDLMLSNLRVTGTAVIQGKGTENQVSSNLSVKDTAFIPGEETEDQAIAAQALQ